MLEHHPLVIEFPEHRERIHTLKTTDAHFARLFENYHQIDREIFRAESGEHGMADENMEDLKKQRLHLKDELYGLLKKA